MMKDAQGATAATTAWTAQGERGSLIVARVMRWMALAAGRRVTRWLLPPLVLWYLLGKPALRRRSATYLGRALGRPATWADGYRHLHAFASVLLDRVYLLQERFDQFEIEASGIEAILEPIGKGIGVLAFGAHVGSFEALRAIGQDKGLRVAMIMYEDNAPLVNETLAALAPAAKLHTIALGRIDAMLALRRWLEDGGVAGLLADRSLPAQSQRSKTVWLPFLGVPAPFSDGPFRLAAMLRRKVVFNAGLYRGGNRYELRFVELADFAGLDAADRDAAVRAAMERYVATLETLCRDAPNNWFNFYDFWGEEAAP